MGREDTASLKAIIESTPENKKCVDCGMVRPQWASTTYGVFFCLNCAGVHRSFGVKISVVKSVSMDAWSPAEIERMRLGGNARFLTYIKNYDLESLPKPELYASKKAREFAQKLQKEVQEKYPESAEMHSPIYTERSERSEIKPSPASVHVNPRDNTAKPLSSTYASSYPNQKPLISLDDSQPKFVQMLGKAAGYLYTGATTLSTQISEKVINPASSLIKEKGTQLTEYMRKKPDIPEKRSPPSKKQSQPFSARADKSSAYDKWE